MVWVAPLLAQRSEYRGLGADSSFYSTVINQQYIRYILTLSGLISSQSVQTTPYTTGSTTDVRVV